jgi:hypothetical protein
MGWWIIDVTGQVTIFSAARLVNHTLTLTTSRQRTVMNNSTLLVFVGMGSWRMILPSAGSKPSDI